jgi:hypothetical protein
MLAFVTLLASSANVVTTRGISFFLEQVFAEISVILKGFRPIRNKGIDVIYGRRLQIVVVIVSYRYDRYRLFFPQFAWIDIHCPLQIVKRIDKIHACRDRLPSNVKPWARLNELGHYERLGCI